MTHWDVQLCGQSSRRATMHRGASEISTIWYQQSTVVSVTVLYQFFEMILWTMMVVPYPYLNC
jgi:hypothetical protein